MSDIGLRLYLKAQQIRQRVREETGQDLVEYALIVAMISFAAVAAMSNIATKVGTSFSNIARKFGGYTS